LLSIIIDKLFLAIILTRETTEEGLSMAFVTPVLAALERRETALTRDIVALGELVLV
jgi:hypothetical protein